jgi:DNA helicase-2/ATP-dependent DNA helicase PcrA
MNLLTDLTPAQREAVTHGEGPLLVLAGPGSGKTRVITRRIAYLLDQGVRPGQVLAITFTNKAAEEMRRRVDDLVPGSRVWVSTFHRFCSRLLRTYADAVGLEPNYSIYDTKDRLRAIREVLRQLELDATHFSPDRIEGAISRAKNDLLGPEEFAARKGDYFQQIVARVYPHYQQSLRDANAADFDDLLLHTASLLRDNPEIRAELDERYRFVLVDEYQDTNRAQYTIARALSVNQPNLCATGDPDQAIYGWRGANLGNILQFERDFAGTRVARLEQNYRSTKSILAVADHLIRFNVRRKAKGLFTENPPGERVRLTQYANEWDEARSIAGIVKRQVGEGRRRWGDFAVFYRVNALSRVIEGALREAGVPYQVVSGLAFYDRKEVKDVLSYLKLLNNPRDDAAFLRIVNCPPRGIGKTTLERLAAFARESGRSLLAAARDVNQVPGIGPRPAAALGRFVELYEALAGFADCTVAEVMEQVLDRSGYAAQFEESSDPQDRDRLDNVQELRSAAHQYDAAHPDRSLEDFLEEASLVSETDNFDDQSDAVTLMTLHAAKGLEFPVVFLIAFEQKLLPHERSMNEPGQLEEERRLLFVGITRAQHELYLSHARSREFRGRGGYTVPSDFHAELPAELIDRGEAAFVPSATPDGWHALSKAQGVGESLPKHPESACHPSERSSPPRPKLTTAAALAGESRPKTPGNSFRTGMLVRHPTYGLGRVVSLDGVGDRQKATVDFSRAGKRRFVIEQSPLEPVG